ncbi:MAG: PAS domain-containing protein [Desulfosporosinus sp.]|nr:PAS domain-containing protein [Desulfosporosinus sp.]
MSKVRESWQIVERVVFAQLDEQYRIIRSNGTIRWIWDRELPICNENEKMTRCVGQHFSLYHSQTIDFAGILPISKVYQIRSFKGF